MCEGERIAESKIIWVKYRFFITRVKMGGNVFRKWWNGLFSEKPTEITTLISFSWEIFLSSTHHSAHLVYEHQVKEENTGLYSLPLKLKPACLPSMALCVQVCWCLNEFEGTWRQDWALSSNKRAMQGISQKGEFIGVWVEQETLPSAVLRRSGCMHAGSEQRPAWLPTVFSFLLTCAAAAAVRKSHSLTHTK